MKISKKILPIFLTLTLAFLMAGATSALAQEEGELLEGDILLRNARQIEALEAQVQSISQKISTLEKGLTDKDEELEDLREADSELWGQVVNMNKKFEYAKEERTELKQELSTVDEGLSALDGRLEEVMAELEEADSELWGQVVNMNKKFEYAKEERSDLKSRLDERVTSLRTKLDSLEERLTNLREEDASLWGYVDSLDAKASAAQQEATAASESVSQLEASVQDGMAALEEELQGSVEDLEEADSELWGQVVNMNKKFEYAKEERASLKEELNDRANALGSKLDSLENGLNDLGEADSQLWRQVDSLNVKINAVEEKTAALQEEFADKVSDLEQKNTELNNQVEELKRQNERLRDEITTLEKAYMQKTRELSERLKELERDRFASSIEVAKEGWMNWVVQGEEKVYRDFAAEVDMKKSEGNAGYYGLLFRMVDNRNFYQYWISDDGYYGLSLSQGAEDGGSNWTTLVGASFSPAINQGNSWNKLKVKAQGSMIELYVNDTLLVTINNGTLEKGQVAVVAETPSDQSYLKVLYEDFKISS